MVLYHKNYITKKKLLWEVEISASLKFVVNRVAEMMSRFQC